MIIPMKEDELTHDSRGERIMKTGLGKMVWVLFLVRVKWLRKTAINA